MLHEVVIELATNRVVEYGHGDKARFRAEPEKYLVTTADVPDDPNPTSAKIFLMGWDGQRVIEIDPPEGLDRYGAPIEPIEEPAAALTPEQVQENIFAALRAKGFNV